MCVNQGLNLYMKWGCWLIYLPKVSHRFIFSTTEVSDYLQIPQFQSASPLSLRKRVVIKIVKGINNEYNSVNDKN